MIETKNIQSNFGITLDDMVCFKSRPPTNPQQNQEALNLIRDGIELFEIPGEGLGIPLEILEEAKSVNILATYLGLGQLLRTGSISHGDEELSVDGLLEQEPYEIISHLMCVGFNYNGIRLMQKRGFTSPEGKYGDRVEALPDEVKERFMHSLREARTTHYSRQPGPAAVEYVVNLIGEVYAAKHNQEFMWFLLNRRMRRLKTRSNSKGREGTLYIAREVISGERVSYDCDCPARRECKHIKELKSCNL